MMKQVPCLKVAGLLPIHMRFGLDLAELCRLQKIKMCLLQQKLQFQNLLGARLKMITVFKQFAKDFWKEHDQRQNMGSTTAAPPEKSST